MAGLHIVTAIDLTPAGFRSPVFQSNVDAPFSVYYDSLTPGSGRSLDDVPLVLRQLCNWRNLSSIYPWLDDAVRRNLKLPNSACVAGNPARCLDARTHYKLAAMNDALGRDVDDGSMWAMLWLDADAQLFRAPDERFYEWATRFDGCTIGRKAAYPDTGVALLNPTECTVRYLSFTMMRIRDWPMNLNDIQLFEEFSNACHVGWFAYGCMPKHTPKYMSFWAPHCPSRFDNDTVSPFHLQDYAIHFKNGSGPISRALRAGPHRAPPARRTFWSVRTPRAGRR